MRFVLSECQWRRSKESPDNRERRVSHGGVNASDISMSTCPSCRRGEIHPRMLLCGKFLVGWTSCEPRPSLIPNAPRHRVTRLTMAGHPSRLLWLSMMIVLVVMVPFVVSIESFLQDTSPVFFVPQTASHVPMRELQQEGDSPASASPMTSPTPV